MHQFRQIFFVLLIITFSWTAIYAGNVVKQVVRVEPQQENLLRSDAYRTYGKGFEFQDGVFRCDNGTDSTVQRGAMQTVVLNQKRPQPILAEAWSRAENVSGSPATGYSIYMDILYADGTPLWGQTADFATGTHDWQKKTVLVVPGKPIQSLSFYVLLRNKSGQAEFRDMKLTTYPFPENGCIFDGTPVIPRGQAKFQIRDVAANSDFFELHDTTLGINASFEEVGQVTRVNLTNPRNEDRCLTVVYAVNVSADGLKWCENLRTDVDVAANTEYVSATAMSNIGTSGRLSFYPFAAVAGNGAGQSGSAIGIDMRTPAFFRTGYHSETSELYVAVDVALTKEAPTARVDFVNFSFDAKDSFRGALAAYYELFPACFECRIKDQGVWMPFAQISKVPNPEDFGFKFKEGNGETAWDDAHDILTFRYTEPMTWWMTMPNEMPKIYEAAIEHARKLAGQGNPKAIALFKSGMHDTEGKLVCQLLDTPWCNGAVWSMNDMPGIESGSFSQQWSQKIHEKEYGQKDRGILDGEYVDSSEGYVTAELDFNRANFSAAKTPLVFSRSDCRPAILRGLIAFEYVREIAEDIHGNGKLMMANSTPDRLCWLAPWLDVMGTETNWNDNGKWSPMPDSHMLYRRAMCGQKPFCFLMNTDFSKFTYELSERFMKRSLAYGMFPGYFSADASTGHYFSRPELYERDRPLFKKYIPLCKTVAEAGWQPLTQAVSDDANVYVERFGTEPQKSYFTVFNDSQEKKTVSINFQQPHTKFKDLVSGEFVNATEGKLKLTLASENVAVLEPVE